MKILIDLKDKCETNRLRQVASEILNKLYGEDSKESAFEEIESFSDLKS
ncbi:hypothetical protein [Senegalia massiliensis]|nr:hypothetical protein [Senegalia massiliensis]